MKKKNKGFLITFEGGEGGGKTTQLVKLSNRLRKLGKEIVDSREPGGTVISEQIREVVLTTKNNNISFSTEVFLFQAARAQIYEEVVIPALKDGKIVIIDRSRDSSTIYQGMVRGYGKKVIEELNDISTNKTFPNLTLLLDVPVMQGLKRLEKAGEMTRIDLEDKSFHEKVRKAYLKIAKEDKTGRWAIIDASKSIEEVAKQVWKVISDKLEV